MYSMCVALLKLDTLGMDNRDIHLINLQYHVMSKNLLIS